MTPAKRGSSQSRRAKNGIVKLNKTGEPVRSIMHEPVINTRDRELVGDLRAAVDWLDWEQPRGALLAPRGLQTRRGYLGGEVYVSLMPVSPAGRAVFVFDREEEWSEDLETLLNPFTEEVIEQLRAAVLEATYPIYSDWNGIGFCTYSLSLVRSSGADARRLIADFARGCPIHETNADHLCEWYIAGRDRVLLPAGWRPRPSPRPLPEARSKNHE